MKFTREETSVVSVRGIGAEGVRIGREWLRGTVALTGEAVLDDWQDKPLHALTEADFDALIATGPEVVVIGTGATQQFAPRELTFAFARRGLGLEVMDSRAAARTFNVLVGEGRRVAALLYAV